MFVYGLVRSIQWHMMTPGYREVTIVFHPHYLQLLLKERLSDFSQNEAVSLYDLFDRNNVERLYENLSRSVSDDEIFRAAFTFIMAAQRSMTLDARIAAAHDLIYASKIRNVEELSRKLNVSSIRLRELFRKHAGLSPKELIKIRRVNEAFRVREHREDSLTRLAYRLEYFDQSHFIHDFKSATGLTPNQYFNNKNLSLDFYNLGRWNHDSFRAH
jgi:AraC-like DNA-binding protein